MIAWITSHPWTAGGIAYALGVWAFFVYCMRSASHSHQEPM